MIVYRKKFIRIVECWDGESPNAARVDLVRYFQQAQPIAGTLCRDFFTIILDLTRPNEELLNAMKRDTRSAIKRATRDLFVYDCWDANPQQVIAEFSDYYDRFATQKRQPTLDRQWLTLLAEAGTLTLTRIREANGETLVWHAYHRGKARATLLHSASLFREQADSSQRSRTGRANRFQHWQDMLRFKGEGVATYDLGGWYEKDRDPERLSINRFKEEFGGKIVKNYICERPLTIKGRLFLRARNLFLGNAI